MKKYNPDDFQLETTSIWSFPERGNWATHDGYWRGNWSPYVVRNLILRYSKVGDLVLDPFVGGGTTMIEAKILNRVGIGIDINDKAIGTSKNKINQLNNIKKSQTQVYLKQGDARNLICIPDNEIDLICAHPPYADIIKYSNDIEGDLSLLSIEEYLDEMKKVAKECYRVLKTGKYCTVLIGDIRKKGFIECLGFKVLDIFKEEGFKLKEIIIKEQHNCKNTEKWTSISAKRNFLLLAHEYLFVFKKL